jgi:hypothetical protein
LNYNNEGVTMSTETKTAEPIVETAEAECELIELDADSEDYKLDARIRCDHSSTVGRSTCGAQSYIQVTLKSGGELFFCKHHGNKVEAKLKPISKTWYTEESRLIENRKQGSEN